MSKRPSKHSRPTLSEQMRHAFIQTLKRHVPLGIEGRQLDDEQLWDILLYASVQGLTIEGACTELADVPSGTTVRTHLQSALDPSCFGVFALEAQLNTALQRHLPAGVRKRLRRKAFEVGIDLTDLPYHGQPAQWGGEIRRGPAKSGTTHFHSYATLAVVHHGWRYEMGLTFVWADETMDQVVDRLLDPARRMGLRLKRAYLDKGFCSQPVFSLLRRRRLPYLIPIPLRGKAGGIRRLFVGRQSYRTTYTFNAGTPKAYTTDVLVVRCYAKGRYGRRKSQWLAYAAYGMDRVPLHQIFALYRRRFGMESGYRQMHRVRARTAAPSPTLRLLLVGLAFLLYNMYILFRQLARTGGHYGHRTRVIPLTLDRMKRSLQRLIEQLFGITSIEQRAVPWMKPLLIS